MYKKSIFIFLLTLLSCQQEKRDGFKMEMPETKPLLLEVEAGLSLDSKKEKIVFERYKTGMARDVRAERIYANGDYYEIYLFSYQNIKDDNLSWKKIGTISQKGIKKIEKISNTSVIDFILAEPDPNHIGDSAVANISWYFYFNQPKFAETQRRMFKWQWWVQPRFVTQMNNVTGAYISSYYPEEPVKKECD